MTFRAVIIDDQASARRGIALVLETLSDVELVGEFGDAESALARLDLVAPDIAFVDIRMPGLSGLELLQRVAGRHMEVVLVTAHDQHAVTAFDLSAADYVLKPFTDERLITATLRAKQRIRNHRMAREAALESEPPGRVAGRGEPRYVSVREDDRIHLVPVSEIVCLKADGNDVRIVTGDGEHAVRSTLKGMLRKLGAGRFIRIHRSHAVNIDAVREIQPWFSGDYLAIMRSGEKLRISRRYKDAILQRVL